LAVLRLQLTINNVKTGLSDIEVWTNETGREEICALFFVLMLTLMRDGWLRYFCFAEVVDFLCPINYYFC
jgi:hypothetical protein